MLINLLSERMRIVGYDVGLILSILRNSVLTTFSESHRSIKRTQCYISKIT